MSHIIPAIIATSTEELSQKIDAVRGLVDWVQVDVMDGIFAPRKTWPYTSGNLLDLKQLKGDLKIEVHFMAEKPETLLGSWIHSGADRILVHYESTDELGVVFDTLKNAKIEFGIALNLETPIDVLDPWIENCSAVQLMGIAEIGYHGRPFSESLIPKAEALRVKYPELTIEVDGGLTIENAMRLAGLGINGLVIGGGIYNAPDPRASLEDFIHNVEQLA